MLWLQLLLFLFLFPFPLLWFQQARFSTDDEQARREGLMSTTAARSYVRQVFVTASEDEISKILPPNLAAPIETLIHNLTIPISVFDTSFF